MSYTKRQQHNRKLMKTIKVGDYIILNESEWAHYSKEQPKKRSDEYIFLTWTYGKITDINYQKRAGSYYIKNIKIQYPYKSSAGSDKVHTSNLTLFNDGNMHTSWNTPKFSYLMELDCKQSEVETVLSNLEKKLEEEKRLTEERTYKKNKLKKFKNSIEKYNKYYFWLLLQTRNKEVNDIPIEFFDAIGVIEDQYEIAMKAVDPKTSINAIPLKVNPPTFTVK